MSDAASLDAADPLRRFRDAFELPRGIVYLAGHSLGPVSKAVVARVAQAVQNEWGHGLVGAWNTADWIGAPQRLGAKIAPLIGARSDEVIVADSVSVNLFKLAGALLAAAPGRKAILVEGGEFPTDMHIAQGLAALARAKVRFARKGTLAERIDARTGVIIVSHVHYRDASVRDMAALTAQAHAAGAEIVWDLSHSVGAIDVDLAGAGARFAVGCTYKYLNGGPGGPAFLYVARDHQERLANPISGWLGHADPFAFADRYEPAPGAQRFVSGTPPILAYAALEAALDLMAEAPGALRRAKSQALSERFLARVFAKKRPGLQLISPADPARRGGHVTLKHKDAYAVVKALIARGVIGDFRAPDAMRFAFPALTLTYGEADAAADALIEVLKTGVYRDPAFTVSAKVT
ncbi:MAG: aminotransferase class V-fold PLP-dependent enzyme [Hydrogenophilaceae bacterium]|jgi:kynureninase|nr:aminotransferase class V-fold PLP-dependent enzyme [Hydrogenophilaceae bacterium]